MEDEFVEDLLTMINDEQKDTICSEEILEELKGYEIGTLLEVKKKIGSSVEILEVKEINEKYYELKDG